jgi:RimJ/RimL family protein N-acetyltransferase
VLPLTMHLQPATQEDFDWLLGNREATRPWKIAPELAPTEVIGIVRQLPANWLMVVDDELVGIVGLKTEDAERVELGYGVAATREGRGFASAAVAALLPILRARGAPIVTAETSIDNPASQRVLERNGFVRVGSRLDEEDGPVITWQRTFCQNL